MRAALCMTRVKSPDQAFFFALALAARFLPATFLTRVRAASVLPRALVAFLRGMARLTFFFRFSTLRAERAPFAAAMMKFLLLLLHSSQHLVVFRKADKRKRSTNVNGTPH